MEQRNCPKCGSDVGPQLASTRMVNCPSCGTSLFLKDDRFLLAGAQGVLHEGATLITLGDRVGCLGQTWQVIGQARFSYGRGWWDEFWASNGSGSTAWISVDEGDVVLQWPVAVADQPTSLAPQMLGDVITFQGEAYQITEIETATCEAIRGTLPEVLSVGDAFRFANCTSNDGRLLSGEFWPGGSAWFIGDWIDPFELRRVDQT